MSAYLAFCPAETSNSKLCSCDLLDLAELQLHRSCAPEDRDHYLQRLAVFINFIHHACKARERTFGDAYRLIFLELDLQLGLVLALGHSVNNLVDLVGRERRGLLARAYKSRN